MHMLPNLPEAAVQFLLRILEQFTKLVVCEPLPDHRRGSRWQMPIGCAWRHMRTFEVAVQVAGAVLDRIDTLPIRSTPNQHCMAMTIVSLARIVSAGMAIYAARVMQYRHKGFEGSSRSNLAVSRHFMEGIRFSTFTTFSGRSDHEQKQHTPCCG